MKYIFQFSSFDDYKIEELKTIVESLGGHVDMASNYSTKATHLVIGKMNLTEKVCGFIAAGKWILTQNYLKQSAKAKKFVEEGNSN